MPSRKRNRSKTPEVRWESLPDAPHLDPIGNPVRPSEMESKVAKVKESDADLADSRRDNEASANVYAEAARSLERHSWRSLMVWLAALRGDPQTEAMLAERHPELQQISATCGPARADPGRSTLSLAEAKVAAAKWFERGLRGSNNHGPSVRASLCDKLRDVLKDRAMALRGTEPSKLEATMEKGKAAEEGPLVCSLLSGELEGSRYEGLWIARVGKGVYSLGDVHEGSGLPKVDSIGAAINPCVKVQVKASNKGLLVDAFFHEGESEPVPARVPIGPFLSVFFEGVPLKDAMAKWKSARKEASSEVAALSKGLPPGWELRESRSKRGVYYYANPSKGLSSYTRPTA